MTATAVRSPQTSSAPTAPAKPGRRNPFAQRGFGGLFRTEIKVWSRDLGNIFWALLFPALILGLNAFMGGDGFTEVMDLPSYHHWYGLSPLGVVVPLFMAMAAGIPFLTMMPIVFGGFREKGVLKRFSGSPMSPQALIATHYLINLVSVVLGAAVMLTIAAVVWGITVPANIAVVALGFVLATASMAGLGTLVSSRIAKASVASAVGQTIFFVLMFAGGIMGGANETIHNISRFTPMGAAAQVMEAGWFGGDFPTLQVVVLLVWTAVFLPLGVKLFKWR